jgi:hypothetical protein
MNCQLYDWAGFNQIEAQWIGRYYKVRIAPFGDTHVGEDGIRTHVTVDTNTDTVYY